jgi:hypothetical protein
MGEPPFGGVMFGLAACGALSGDPQVDDLSHAKPRCRALRFGAKCADTVAGIAAGVGQFTECGQACGDRKTRLSDRMD